MINRIHTPDRWILVRLVYDDDIIVKVLGSWNSGYLIGESWRLSSGVKEIIPDGDFYNIENVSGSIYRCHKEESGVNSEARKVLGRAGKHAEVSVISVDEFNKEFKDED